MNDRILQEIWRILDADLPSATESVALRLVRRASPYDGQTNLTWDEYLSLCKSKGEKATPNRDAARRHLIVLSRRHIIHYSTNDNIYVTFLGWLMDDMGYQPTKIARESAIIVANRDNYCRESRQLLSHLSSSSSSSEIDSEYVFREDLVPQAKRMLRECGIYPNDAERLAQAYPFETLREHIFTWRADKNARGPGSLKHRIEHHFHRDPLTHDDRQSAFYWRFRTPEEEYAAEPATVTDDAVSEEPATEPPTPPPPVELDLWQRTLQDLEMMMPAQTYSMISSASLITATDNELLLSVPAFAQTMLERLQARIQRELKRIAGKPMGVQFVPAEAAHAHQP